MTRSVLIVHNRYRFQGGEERIVELQRDLLAQRGHAVSLYEADSAALEKRGPWAKLSAAVSMPFSVGHYLRFRRRLRRERPDIVHVHNVFPLLTPAIYHAARAENVPVVQSVHNYRFLCSNGLFLLPNAEVCERCRSGNHAHAVRFGCYAGSRWRSAGMALTLSLHEKAFRTVPRLFIAPSQFLKDKLVAGGFPEAKIRCLKPGFPGAGERAEPDGKTLLYVGRLSREKGVGVLVRAAAALSDWTIIVAGRGPEEEALQRQAKSAPNVRFAGHVGAADLERLYRTATALVLPSICYENLPSVVLEGWRFGLPAVVSKMGGMSELVEEGVTGFHFRPGDPGDLAQAVRRTLTWFNPSLRDGIRERLQRDFGLDAYYQRLTEAYAEVSRP